MKQILVAKTQNKLLKSIVRASSSSQALARRAEIILGGVELPNQLTISKDMRISRDTVRKWLTRWQESASELECLEAGYDTQQLTEAAYQRGIADILADAPRPGAPSRITEEQKALVIAMATDKPENADVPITNWTCSTLRDAVVDKGIVTTISRAHIHRFLKESHAQTARK